MKWKSTREVKRAVNELLAAIENHRKEAEKEGMTFVSLGERELIRKEKGLTAKSPYSYGYMCTPQAARGSQATYRLYLRNPDPSSTCGCMW